MRGKGCPLVHSSAPLLGRLLFLPLPSFFSLILGGVMIPSLEAYLISRAFVIEGPPGFPLF